MKLLVCVLKNNIAQNKTEIYLNSEWFWCFIIQCSPKSKNIFEQLL